VPRKLRNKRVVKTLELTRRTISPLLDSMQAVVDRFPETIAALEKEIGCTLDAKEAGRIKDVLLYATLGGHLPPDGRKPNAVWRDFLLLELRLILSGKGISVSLGFTDKARSEIDTPFARGLRVLWESLPPISRGKSASALVARARALKGPRARLFELFLITNVRGCLHEAMPHIRGRAAAINALTHMIEQIKLGNIQVPNRHLSSPQI
jgi:hypothetical protein